jgi:hypothetical protein
MKILNFIKKFQNRLNLFKKMSNLKKARDIIIILRNALKKNLKKKS